MIVPIVESINYKALCTYMRAEGEALIASISLDGIYMHADIEERNVFPDMRRNLYRLIEIAQCILWEMVAAEYKNHCQRKLV